MKERIELIRKKAQFYKNQNLAVHIVKKNNWFYNGNIIDIGTDFLILMDDKEGEMIIFFLEINEIEKREDRR